MREILSLPDLVAGCFAAALPQVVAAGPHLLARDPQVVAMMQALATFGPPALGTFKASLQALVFSVDTATGTIGHKSISIATEMKSPPSRRN